MPTTKKINKVIYAGETLIDLTGDTVDSSTLLSGATAHDKSGEVITGACTYDSDTSDATAAAAEILTGKTVYARGAKVTGTMPNNAAFTSNITDADQKVTIPAGYHDGSGKIGISATDVAKLIATNIRDGVTILGVEGSMSGTEDAKPQAKTVTPSKTQQVVLPDSDYNYLSQVTVLGIPYVLSENSAGGQTATIG